MTAPSIDETRRQGAMRAGRAGPRDGQKALQGRSHALPQAPDPELAEARGESFGHQSCCGKKIDGRLDWLWPGTNGRTACVLTSEIAGQSCPLAPRSPGSKRG